MSNLLSFRSTKASRSNANLTSSAASPRTMATDATGGSTSERQASSAACEGSTPEPLGSATSRQGPTRQGSMSNLLPFRSSRASRSNANLNAPASPRARAVGATAGSATERQGLSGPGGEDSTPEPSGSATARLQGLVTDRDGRSSGTSTIALMTEASRLKAQVSALEKTVEELRANGEP